MEITNQLFLSDYAGFTDEQVRKDIVEEFVAEYGTASISAELNRFDILIALMEDGCYDSACWFLLRERATGNLFELHASHCSCYGYEGQWKPELTTVEYLKSENFSCCGVREYRGQEQSPETKQILAFIAGL